MCIRVGVAKGFLALAGSESLAADATRMHTDKRTRFPKDRAFPHPA